jgi:thiamine-phosphate pyrophosphorylase
VATDFTAAATRALEAARLYAGRVDAAQVQPLHLLQGLLEEEEGLAANLLAGAGVKVAILRHNLNCSLPIESEPTSEGLTLSSEVEAIVSQARFLTKDVGGEQAVSGTMLLMSLVRREPALKQFLETHGLDTARLEREFHATQGPPLKLDEELSLEPPRDQIDIARVLDANFNRAREAIRVVEDYCRFVLDDKFLSSELKQMRHDLAEVVETLPAGLLIASRDTQRDVGTSLSTDREGKRTSPLDVAQTNLKRLQEALRSLEEFAKLQGAELGRELEAIRYRSYTVERAVLLGVTAHERLAKAQLYLLVTGSQCKSALDWTIQEAVDGGVGIVQLREKELDDRRLLERARQVRKWTRQARVLFIVNDRPDLARLVEADGVHLGQDDMPVKEARRILGPDALIGVSTHDLQQVRQAVLDGASYIGVGPAFPSTTKTFEVLAGLDFVREALAETTLTAFVIGGINQETIEAVAKAGAKRVAVSAAICQADEPRQVASELLRHLRNKPASE